MTDAWQKRITYQNRIVGYGTSRAGDLLANSSNWRIHSKHQQDVLTGVLGDVGIVQNIIVNRRTSAEWGESQNVETVLDGHLRVSLAISQSEDTEVPVTYVDLSPNEESLVLATFDPIGALASADDDQLKALIAECETDNAAVKALLEELAGVKVELPEAPEPQIDKADELREKWQTASGQLWEIPSKTVAGKAHRLLCGDSTKAEDVARLMNGEKAVLMATDPPYGVDFEGQKYNPRAKAWDGIAGDQRQGLELQGWLQLCLSAWFPHISQDAAFYLWTAAMEEGAAAAAAIRASGLHIQAQIIWNKNTLILGQADYQWKHENCWYAFWKGKQHRWFGGRDKTTVWDVSKVANQNYTHPMEKPTELYAIPMRHHTQTGEICAEPFSGSGSQFVAAEQLGRLCYGMEIEPKYVAVCLQRMADMGLEPRLSEATCLAEVV